jgi:hypothetical protein
MFILLTTKSDSMLNCYLKKYLTGIIMLMLLAAKINPAAAQDSTAVKGTTHPGWTSGVVLDEYSQPLKGATITINGQTDVITTASNGSFEVNVRPGAIITVSAPNHNSRQIMVRNEKSLYVKLEDSFLRNPQDINVLYGSAKKANFLGSIATIYTNQITTTPASLYVYAFPGQLAGLYTKQNSGFTSFNTTALSSASIIGQTLVNSTSNNNGTSDNQEIGVTVRGQNPITIIDGVQREISSLDPESIESISILKDGLSTILLGMNSSRPVILVTTKRGDIGKPRITFTAATGVQQSLSLPKPLPAYQYAYLLNETLTSDGKVALY